MLKYWHPGCFHSSAEGSAEAAGLEAAGLSESWLGLRVLAVATRV